MKYLRAQNKRLVATLCAGLWVLAPSQASALTAQDIFRQASDRSGCWRP